MRWRDDLIERLRKIEVSTLCDGDKSIPIVDPVVRALVPDVRMAGVARTVIAEDDHLLGADRAGVRGARRRAGGRRRMAASARVLGELSRPRRCGAASAGLVVDGYIRDLQGIRKLGLPLFARGTYPASGSAVSRAAPSTGPSGAAGWTVSPGDIVFGDDDGIVIAAAERVAAALEGAEARHGPRPACSPGSARGVR